MNIYIQFMKVVKVNYLFHYRYITPVPIDQPRSALDSLLMSRTMFIRQNLSNRDSQQYSRRIDSVIRRTKALIKSLPIGDGFASKSCCVIYSNCNSQNDLISLIRPDEASANSTIDNNRKPLRRAVKYIQELDERE